MIHTKPNLAEAQTAVEKLLPHLPWPRLTEHMNCCGLALPKIGDDPNLPVLEQPETLVANLGPYIYRKLPQHWLAAYYHHKQRLSRNAQLIRLRPLCQESDNGFEADLGYVPDELDDTVDGIVAGVLVLAVKPLPGPLRTKLLAVSQRHWFGSFLALHGMMFAGEAESLLAGVACDPRLAAALWRENQDLAEPLVPVAMAKNDLWSATIALHQPLASEWLGRVNIFGETDPLAAVSALVLQPTAPQKTLWVQQLKQGHPRLAYIATRWARFTWPESGWENLRDELHTNAVSDRGLAWFGWYRDVQPELIDEAIRETDVATLWQAELVDHANNSGQELRRRMVQRLQSDAKDKEALLTVRWLDRRGRLR